MTVGKTVNHGGHSGKTKAFSVLEPRHLWMTDSHAVFAEKTGKPINSGISKPIVLKVNIHAVLRSNTLKNACLRAFQNTSIRRISPCC